MSDIRADSIPNFVKAQSPQGLRRVMLLNNVRLGSFVNYYGISSYRDDKNKLVFIAWFFESIKNNDSILDIKAGE